MSISTLNDYIASSKQVIPLTKTTSRTTTALTPFSVFDVAGQPGAGTLAGTSTTQGVVPTDATTGYPLINAFGASAIGYVSRVQYSSSVAGRISLYDRLFVSGAHNFNAADTLASQPSFASRLPNSDYAGTQIWMEAVTTFTGNPTVTVTYTNQAGVAGRSTGAIALGLAPTVGRMTQLPLQAGDTGVQKIESVTCTVATVGTFNINVLRPLIECRSSITGDGDVFDMLKTGLPQIFDTSALFMTVTPDSTATGVPNVLLEISNK